MGWKYVACNETTAISQLVHTAKLTLTHRPQQQQSYFDPSVILPTTKLLIKNGTTTHTLQDTYKRKQ
jgi:hypothetical protein